MTRAMIVCLAAAGLSTSAAQAGLIDFETPFASGPSVTFVSDGVSVTFSDPGSVFHVASFGSPFPDDGVLFPGSYNLTVTFSSAVDNVTVGNLVTGLYTSEVDVITGMAYDSSNNLLGTVTNSNTAHTLAFTGISKIVYTAPNTGFAISYLSFVPSPGVAGLFGLAALGAARRRR
ncbi:MAG: hypothetical protein SFY95_02970 [Planctomycetota bacterium]|nr:hypothetical protein [Planctomycetota bacterium]